MGKASSEFRERKTGCWIGNFSIMDKEASSKNARE